MEKQELVNCLHQYTPWEMFHLQNLAHLQDIENLNQSLATPFSESDKSYGLHLPHIPDSEKQQLEEKVYFPDKNKQDILIVQHDRYTVPQMHSHEFFEFMYVYEGEFIQQISGTRLLMHTGDFCIIPPDIYHMLDVHNYSIVLNILVPKEKFQNMILNHLNSDNILSTFFLGNVYSENLNNYIIFHTNGDIVIQNLILDMCLEVINKKDYYMHFLNTDFLLLLGHLLRNYEDTCILPKIKQKKDSQNFAILKYIETNYNTLTLETLAEHFHYSPQHMSKRLQQITGMPFTEYIREKKMKAASELLIKTNMSVKKISELTGYANSEHFLRTFKKQFGLTPTAYRNTHQIQAAQLI